jgi:hypothetical protein
METAIGQPLTGLRMRAGPLLQRDRRSVVSPEVG